MKPREDRQKVMIRARMRSGASWRDVCILNVSLRGLGVQSAETLERGAYVEVCRGTQAIIARVVWSKGHRAGLRSQDAIFVRALIGEHPGAPPPREAQTPIVDRRRAPRTSQLTHDRSRLMGRTLEFASLALVVAAMAMTAFGAVEQALAQPLSKISAALG